MAPLDVPVDPWYLASDPAVWLGVLLVVGAIALVVFLLSPRQR